jgi:hypothetical protein
MKRVVALRRRVGVENDPILSIGGATTWLI